MKILLHISFIGTNYCGYQVQPNGITIQQKLNEAAERLFGYPCDIVGCSRTDSGVHANEFCASVSKKKEKYIETNIPIERIPLALTSYLPEDISVNFAEWVDDEFHPRYNVKYKEYVYKIWNHPVRNPFLSDRAWHCPKKIDEPMLERMQVASKRYVGTHDFSSYMASDSKVIDTVRTVTSAQVYREGEHTIIFKVCADGFLYNMVRIMTGTLIDTAYGKIEPEEIDEITGSRDRRKAGTTAPPCGLYLNKVVYH
jgi:tRNA pseudouridine38-40 synthase